MDNKKKNNTFFIIFSIAILLIVVCVCTVLFFMTKPKSDSSAEDSSSSTTQSESTSDGLFLKNPDNIFDESGASSEDSTPEVDSSTLPTPSVQEETNYIVSVKRELSLGKFADCSAMILDYNLAHNIEDYSNEWTLLGEHYSADKVEIASPGAVGNPASTIEMRQDLNTATFIESSPDEQMTENFQSFSTSQVLVSSICYANIYQKINAFLDKDSLIFPAVIKGSGEDTALNLNRVEWNDDEYNNALDAVNIGSTPVYDDVAAYDFDIRFNTYRITVMRKISTQKWILLRIELVDNSKNPSIKAHTIREVEAMGVDDSYFDDQLRLLENPKYQHLQDLISEEDNTEDSPVVD